MSRSWKLGLVCLIAGVSYVIALKSYQAGDEVDVFVNKVGPFSNPHETYHYYQLPLCRPDKIVHKALSLGQVLEGDRLAESFFEFAVMKDQEKVSLCKKKDLDEEETKRLTDAVQDDFYFELVVDDLKVRNFVGLVEESNMFPHEHKIFLYTHYVFHVEFNGKNIISVNLQMDKDSLVEIKSKTIELELFYTVRWNKTDSPSSNRVQEGQTFFSARTMHIHWLSVINSALLVVLLLVFVTLIIFSAVRRDLSKYNRDDEDEDLLLDNGWKTVGMDVFRKPTNPMLLSAILGVGAQFLVIAGTILLVGSLNVVNVHRHGMLNTLGIVLYALTSGIAGYISSKKYSQLEGRNWVANINLTSFLFAGPMVLGWALSNTVSWAYGSTQALPWTTVMVVLGIWLVIGYPLNIFGGVMGRNFSGRYSAPCRTRNIPRQLPTLPFYHSTPIFSIIGGFLPFSAISVELYYIFATVWGRESYTLFYMLFIVYFILLAVVACTSVALTYFQLNAEDYRWWWRSIFIGGSVGMFVFAYGVFFVFWRSEMSGWVQLTEYFTHLSLLAYVFFLTMAAVSHTAAHTFVQFIYSSVKTD